MLEAQDISISYDDFTVIKELSLRIPKNQITVLVGSNGCGKSTFLRALARLIQPKGGHVYLDNKEIQKQSTREVAKKLSILPQITQAPEGVTVRQLVKQGRYPHHTWYKGWSKKDEEKIEEALAATNMLDLADRELDTLSGGQKQRAWIAMVLAQDTEYILLDEPTTFLDLAHQIDVLNLMYELNRKMKKTIVMVLHDINLACRYADYMVAISKQKVAAEGPPNQIVSAQMIDDVFGLKCQILRCPLYDTPYCIPYSLEMHSVTKQALKA